MEANIPLQLTTSNTRDLGGYPCTDGKKTQKNKFLRSDGLDALTLADKEILKEQHDVTIIIDLRSNDEVERSGYDASLFTRFHVPLLDGIASNSAGKNYPTDMGLLYIDLLSNSQSIFKKIFEIIASNMDHCTLFHCTAGKDRTGVTAMLLLDLVGVDHEIIVNDYKVTEIYMKERLEKQFAFIKSKGVDIPKEVLLSKPHNMETALDYLYTNFGGAEKYLITIGVSQQEIDYIKTKFVK